MSYRIGSIQDFYQWAKSRNPDETYKYFDLSDCAVKRYMTERGLPYSANPKSPLEWAAQQENTRPETDMNTLLTMGGLEREIREHFLHA